MKVFLSKKICEFVTGLTLLLIFDGLAVGASLSSAATRGAGNMMQNDMGAIECFSLKCLMKFMFNSSFGYVNAVDTGNLEVNQFMINSSDGSILESFSIRAHGASKAHIVLAHPFLRYGLRYFFNKKELLNRLVEEGYELTMFNFKGFGNSTVEGPRFAFDIDSVGHWAREHVGSTRPSFLLGCSFGGLQAIPALAYNSELFDKVVFDSVPFAGADTFKSAFVGPMMGWLSTTRWGYQLGLANIVDDLLKITTPIHFLYGAEDPFIDPDGIKRLRDHESVSFSQFPGAKHLKLGSVDSVRYIEEIVRYFDEYFDEIKPSNPTIKPSDPKSDAFSRSITARL